MLMGWYSQNSFDSLHIQESSSIWQGISNEDNLNDAKVVLAVKSIVRMSCSYGLFLAYACGVVPVVTAKPKELIFSRGYCITHLFLSFMLSIFWILGLQLSTATYLVSIESNKSNESKRKSSNEAGKKASHSVEKSTGRGKDHKKHSKDTPTKTLPTLVKQLSSRAIGQVTKTSSWYVSDRMVSYGLSHLENKNGITVRMISHIMSTLCSSVIFLITALQLLAAFSRKVC